MQRMREENDFAGIDPIFFSTSNLGGEAPKEAGGRGSLQDAKDQKTLSRCDVLVTCQGGEYTAEVYGPLLKSGWQGYWIDAASTLRMEKDAVIILDPVNGAVIQDGLSKGIRTFAGGNCTVSLMLMAVAGLLKAGLVEWICLVDPTRATLSQNALEVDRLVIDAQRSVSLPTQEFGAPLAGSVLAWIDKDMPGGQTKEEWKGMAETNKILGLNPSVPVDGICVRVGTMRCHSQGLCIKLKKDLPLPEIEKLITGGNSWVRVSGTLNVPIGRLHKLKMGPEYLGAFTVGDQLLWGAAEPLRRMLNILRAHLGETEPQLVSAQSRQ
jgi:aspartate-semialdehyde dehydrogenase